MNRPLVLCVVVMAGCTRTNPDFTVGGAIASDLAQATVVDLAAGCGAGACLDLSRPVDLVAPPPRDLAMADLQRPPDTAGGPDLLPFCGGVGQPCCVMACVDGAACDGGTCKRCGGPGQLCCVGDLCNENGCCEAGKCVAANTPCARGDLCARGRCSGCGGVGLACCPNLVCRIGCCFDNGCIAPNAPCGPGEQCLNGACAKSNACGLLGNACCNDDSCLQGQCDPNLHRCTDCGGPGQKCCNNNSCYDGGCCLNGACARSGRSCGVGQVCDDGQCVGCGRPAQPCCEAEKCAAPTCCGVNRTCVTENSSCGNQCVQRMGPPSCGTCMASSCARGTNNQDCGGVGEPCCVTADISPNFCSAPGTACFGPGAPAAGNCVLCGKDKQACCAANACHNGGCCVDGLCHDNGNSCDNKLGKCVDGGCGDGACGRPGQPCCGGKACTAGDTICFQGRCVACGGLGERCCRDGGSGIDLWCAQPYHTKGLKIEANMLVGTCVCE